MTRCVLNILSRSNLHATRCMKSSSIFEVVEVELRFVADISRTQQTHGGPVTPPNCGTCGSTLEDRFDNLDGIRSARCNAPGHGCNSASFLSQSFQEA